MNAWETAVDLLSRRDRSETELRRRLLTKRFDEIAIEEAIERCKACGYLDDRRFARQKVEALQSSGRAVGRRLQMELRRAGIGDEIAAEAINAADDEGDPVTVLHQLLQRRYPNFVYESADARLKKRVFDYFLRRGFTRDQIFQALRSRDQA